MIDRHDPLPAGAAQQFRELQERATKDALSGLLNRGTVEMYVSQRLASLPPEEKCAFFMVDLDNFKAANDTLGHQAGDQAIRQSARILASMFRATDIVGRLGGDEFMVFFSGQVEESLVRRKGEEICQRMQLVLGENPSVTLTVSVGIYIATGANQTFEKLYQAADQALYKAKKNGKHGFYIQYSQDLPGKTQDGFQAVNTISLGGLLENMDSGVALLEMGETIRLIYVSPSFCRVLGVEAEHFPLPRPLAQIIHPDDWPHLEQTLRQGAAQGGHIQHTHRISPDGKAWFWWQIRASRIEYNNPYPVMLVTTTDVSPFKENETQLLESNERLRSAFEQTTQGMWEVDLQSRIFTLYHYSKSPQVTAPPQGKFPDFLIENGWIHPSSVKNFREFVRELLEGRIQGYGNFIIQFQDTGCYSWASLSYRRLEDDAGAVRAVGIIEKPPQTMQGPRETILTEHALPDVMTPYLVGVLHGNLSRNSVEKYWMEGRHAGRGTISCAQALEQGRKKMFSEDDRRALSAYFDVAQLLALFARGERICSMDYRRVDGSGSIGWVNCLMNLAQDSLTRDIHLYLWLLRADARHRYEQELETPPVRDAETGLYDRATTRALVEARMNQGIAVPCAFALIQLEGLDRLEQTSPRQGSHPAAVLGAVLGPRALVGQYTRQELLVFFPEANQDEVKQMLEGAFAFVRTSLADVKGMDSLRFVAGVVAGDAAQAHEAVVIAQCHQLCQGWQNASSDIVAFSQEAGDWSQLRQSCPEDQVTVQAALPERSLTEEEKDTALKCVSAMLSAGSLEASVRGMLQVLGNFYRADRVYVLLLGENRPTLRMPWEWTSATKPSRQQAISGLTVEQFPMLQRCLKEQAVVFLTRSMASTAAGEEGEPWRLAVLPLKNDQRMAGFLCIENPREHLEDAALAAMLVPHIAGEEKRFHPQGQEQEDSGEALLLSLPNLRSYTNAVCTLTSDAYSSMGAVCLDIPGLPSINGSLGFAYGREVLQYVSRALADLFGSTHLFRTWDAEFVTLCPNTTHEVFLGRCNRLRSVLECRYPKTVRVGYTWADGVFTGKELVNEARSIMRCERVPLQYRQDCAQGATLHSAGDFIRPKRFTVYFQPKVNMTDGTVTGAEALVRGLDERGRLVSSGRFIPEMEEKGLIRDLDLYVLNRTLAQLDQWRRKGLASLPVSVNFSRFTLFDPTLPASVLAIQSQYSLLEPGLVEVEITESAGNVESKSLSDAMDRFHQLGLQFALDDFGSQYANVALLTHVKFDCLKLDRTLISDLAGNRCSQMLVRDLVEICHTSGMRCVAEGVETQAQKEVLLQAGCIYGQGFLFDPPLSAEAFERKYLHGTQKQ